MRRMVRVMVEEQSQDLMRLSRIVARRAEMLEVKLIETGSSEYAWELQMCSVVHDM